MNVSNENPLRWRHVDEMCTSSDEIIAAEWIDASDVVRSGLLSVDHDLGGSSVHHVSGDVPDDEIREILSEDVQNWHAEQEYGGTWTDWHDDSYEPRVAEARAEVA